MPEGTIQVERLPDARAFLEAAGPFLERREAEHNLLFGIAATLMTDPDRPMTAPPLFAVVRRAGEVVAAALMTPPFNVVLSWTDEASSRSDRPKVNDSGQLDAIRGRRGDTRPAARSSSRCRGPWRM